MLKDIYNSLEKFASLLGDYRNISKTDLANGYCDADDNHDEAKKNQYLAALMLRYWYKIFEWYKNSKSTRLEIEDYVSWLSESFDIAFKYRRWRDPKDKLYNDPNGPDKVFNRCFYSTRNRWYDYFNKDKRRMNYYAYSLEESIDIHGDAADGLLVEDDENHNYNINIDYIIQHFLDKNRSIEAVIIDNICYWNPFRKSNNQLKFDEKKLVKNIKNLDIEKYLDYLSSKYIFDVAQVKQDLVNIKEYSPTKIKNIILKKLESLKNNKGLIDSYVVRDIKSR